MGFLAADAVLGLELRDPRGCGRANRRDPVTPPHLPGGKTDRRRPASRKFQQRVDTGERARSAGKPTQPNWRSS